MATTYTTNYNLGKQENHADKFDMDVLTDNADKIDAALAGLQSGIDGKQATLTTAQLDAVNSGITSADVTQIGVNKNNILSVADQTTQYNIVPIKSTISTGNASVTATVNADKSITIEITGTTSTAIGFEISDNFNVDTNTEYVMTGNPSAGAIRLILQQAESPYNWIGQQYNNQAAVVSPNISLVRYYVYIYANSSGTITIKPMLTPKALWDKGLTQYQPYALSNVELTEITNNFKIVKSVITNTNTTFTPDTNSHYLIVMQAGTSSALYSVYRTSAINIAKIAGSMTTDSVTESGGVVTIAITAWSVISIIKIG